MIWIHTYEIGKKELTTIHTSEESANASKAVLKGEIKAYAEVKGTEND